MAATRIAFGIDRKTVQERSSFTARANFLNRSTGAAVTPTNVKYRVDDLATGLALQDWTSATPSTAVDIVITTAQNAIQNDFNAYELKQLTVASDYGLSTQYVDTLVWNVRNIQGLN